MLVAAAGCGEEFVYCSGPPAWSRIDGEVLSATEPETAYDATDYSEVVVRDQIGVNHTIEVFGRPDMIEIGATYRFEVTDRDSAFLGLDHDLTCLKDPRLSRRLDR